MEDRDRFYEALDRDVERAGLPVRDPAHGRRAQRSSAELAERYGAETPPLPPSGPSSGRRRDRAADGGSTSSSSGSPSTAALVSGDVLLGRDGGLGLDAPWLGDALTRRSRALRPLLDLPVERVLVTHGEPVLEDGHEALDASACRG